MGQTKLTREEIEHVISKVQFMDRTFRLLDKGDGYLLQMEYMEADVEKPGSEPVKQSTRKWYISPYMTESENRGDRLGLRVPVATPRSQRALHLQREARLLPTLRRPHADGAVRSRVPFDVRKPLLAKQ